MKVRCQHLTYQETGRFSKLLMDYVAGEEQLKEFYAFSPDIKGFEAALAARKEFPVDRNLLANVFREQYRRIFKIKHIESLNPAPFSNERREKDDFNNSFHAIELIRDENTFTITTGQQTGIFLGPLYTLLKAITVIKLSRELKAKFPDCNFIPVFWMATEDHDKAEINHAYIGNERFEWKTAQTGAVGRFVTDGLQELSAEIIDKLGIGKFDKALKALLSEAYQQKTLADATFYLLHHLLGQEGLLVLNPDDAELKKAFSKTILDDILEQKSFEALNQTSEKLAQHYPTQITGRTINMFYLSENNRTLIFDELRYKNSRTFTTADKLKSWTLEELKTEVENQPENFSPNVVMRPVYQEQILPNLAYIGGAAEIAYWLQLKEVFKVHNSFFPVLIPRNTVGFLSSSSAQKIEKLGLKLKDFFSFKEQLIKQFILAEKGHQLLLAEEKQILEKLIVSLKQKAENTDPTLVAAAEAMQQRMAHQLDRFSKKLLRAEKQKEEVAIQRIEQVLAELFPQGKLQERHDTFLPYYLEYGDDFVKMLLEELEPLEFGFVVIKFQ
jgi:bacillithiol biosynthesis cysteine-adding enzyme BshC